jgi:hypothetical protein
MSTLLDLRSRFLNSRPETVIHSRRFSIAHSSAEAYQGASDYTTPPSAVTTLCGGPDARRVAGRGCSRGSISGSRQKMLTVLTRPQGTSPAQPSAHPDSGANRVLSGRPHPRPGGGGARCRFLVTWRASPTFYSSLKKVETYSA